MTYSDFEEALAEFQLDDAHRERVLRLAKSLTPKRRDDLLDSLRAIRKEATANALEEVLQGLANVLTEAEHQLHAAEHDSRSKQENDDRSTGLSALETRFSDV
jgi:CRISPR/Cas system-associated protein Csm6